jgi:hypothetical protein
MSKSVKRLSSGKWAVVDKSKKNPATKLPGLIVATLDSRDAARKAAK